MRSGPSPATSSVVPTGSEPPPGHGAQPSATGQGRREARPCRMLRGQRIPWRADMAPASQCSYVLFACSASTASTTLLPSVCPGQPCASAALAAVIDLAIADLDPGIHPDLCSAPELRALVERSRPRPTTLRALPSAGAGRPGRTVPRPAESGLLVLSPRGQARYVLERLTDREREVLALMAEGHSTTPLPPGSS